MSEISFEEMEKKQYTSIKVPKILADKIMNNLNVQSWGYRSVSEFIIESSRLKLMKEYPKN